ncbi:uncharacterized protein LOC122310298 [Carya illinoinensis]|uniref:uncharacterized protein LOC122310298 n=1 Tax=Carya illinoinensis TaxID=32201 RepID=UPI001C728866|nr:uncharacterized protein LOC122310298 [Carya illinoinensis]
MEMSRETEPCTSVPIAPSSEVENVNSCSDIRDRFVVIVEGERIEMELNILGQPIKKPDSKVGMFKVPDDKLDVFKKWILKDLGKKWKDYKHELKKKLLNEKDTFVAQIVARASPDMVDLEQLTELANLWFDPEYMSKCNKNKECRKTQVEMEKLLTQDTNPIEMGSEGTMNWKSDDIYSKVVGLERPGRVCDADEPLYEGCTKHTKFSAIVRLWNMKCLGGLSNSIFTELLEFVNELLPPGASLPKNAYEAKKYMNELGLGYEKILVCPNGCMLFWKENENLETCVVCGASKWKQKESMNDMSKKGKRSPAKILRWFPLKTRLQMLFMSSKTSSQMKWHAVGRTNDGVLRHPVDGMAWKTFDTQHDDFASDPRNVRLGLSADGFNPFGNMSISYSTWLVMLVPYNLPPWMCMKRSSFMLSLIIPGPSSPSMNIDVYLEPLISELKELWEVGAPTYDICSREIFTMCVVLMWTISDFPAYGDLSGWSMKGRLACPICMGNTRSRWLKHGKKFSYMGHRRFLPSNHRWRMMAKTFDGTREIDPSPTMPTPDEILEQLDDLNYNLLRHNLDVMHIEENVVDNIVGTLLNIDTKSKDGIKARLDLQEMGLRPQLHLIITDANKTYLPPAIFTMSNKEKEDLLKVIQNVKVPDGYSSNVSRCVKLQHRTIVGMKSHDCHILMQQLLPIALRGSLPKKVIEPLIELSGFFRGVCSKMLRLEDLDRLESRIPYILCQLEMIFSPSFFTVMVHLTIHLVAECKLGGPVHYRWMYPVERYLHRLKFHVHNKAAPEGSIAEGYLLEELLTFCSRYLESALTVFNRPSRNPDDSKGKVVDVRLDFMSWTQAHRYILFNSDDFTPFRMMHLEIMRHTVDGNHLSNDELQKRHEDQFCNWFQDYVMKMDDNGRSKLGQKVVMHSKGPMRVAKEFKRIVINGIKYRTRNHENGKKTQNCGVSEYVTQGRGFKEDEFGFTIINFSHLVHIGSRITNDPFVLSSQVSQVFYVADERCQNWVVVVKTKPRDVYDTGEEEVTDDDEDEYFVNEYCINTSNDEAIELGIDDVVWTRNDIDGMTIETR